MYWSLWNRWWMCHYFDQHLASRGYKSHVWCDISTDSPCPYVPWRAIQRHLFTFVHPAHDRHAYFTKKDQLCIWEYCAVKFKTCPGAAWLCEAWLQYFRGCAWFGCFSGCEIPRECGKLVANDNREERRLHNIGSGTSNLLRVCELWCVGMKIGDVSHCCTHEPRQIAGCVLFDALQAGIPFR